MKEHKLGQIVEIRGKHFIVTEDSMFNSNEAADAGCITCGFNPLRFHTKICRNRKCTTRTRSDGKNINYKLATKQQLLNNILLRGTIIKIS